MEVKLLIAGEVVPNVSLLAQLHEVYPADNNQERVVQIGEVSVANLLVTVVIWLVWLIVVNSVANYDWCG